MWSEPESYNFLVWPLVAAWGIFWFREPISRLIDRSAIKYERQGLHAATGPQEQREQKTEIVSVMATNFFDPRLLAMYRKDIEHFLEQQKIEPGPTRERELFDIAAAFVIVTSFERHYALIFGSQLAALQALNAASETGYPIEVMKSWYDLGSFKAPETYKSFSFEEWLAFLENATLAMHPSPDRIGISVNGRSFLKFVVDQGYTMDKPF
jgi:hypothetical protein